MNGSLVPANTKRATLILGMFKLFPDVGIGAVGTVITGILLFTLSNIKASTTWLIISLIPMLVCIFLIWPIPNYHNFMGAIQSIIGFYNGRRKYIWRGWCVKYELEKDKQ